jgi:hypothetical protein
MADEEHDYQYLRRVHGSIAGVNTAIGSAVQQLEGAFEGGRAYPGRAREMSALWGVAAIALGSLGLVIGHAG